MVFSNSSRTCSQSPFHICLAQVRPSVRRPSVNPSIPQANYGYVEVNWAERRLRMGVRTPEEKEEMFHQIEY